MSNTARGTACATACVSDATRPAPAARERVHIRPVQDEADAFFIDRLWRAYFGTDPEWWRRDPRGDDDRSLVGSALPAHLATAVGWNTDPGAPATAFVAVHDPPAHNACVRVGGGVVALYDREHARDELPDGGLSFDVDALLPATTAFLAFGAVDPAWRGRGIGGELMYRRLRWASDHDATLAMSYSWRRDGRPTSRPLFKRFGFHPIGEYPEMYARNRPACPDCGVSSRDDRTCRCSATLFVRDLPLPARDLGTQRL